MSFLMISCDYSLLVFEDQKDYTINVIVELPENCNGKYCHVWLLSEFTFNTSGLNTTKVAFKRTLCNDDTTYQFHLLGMEGTFYLCALITDRLVELTDFPFPIPQNGDYIGYFGSDGFLPPSETNLRISGTGNRYNWILIQVKKFSK
jgi:hypothetical protein